MALRDQQARQAQLVRQVQHLLLLVLQAQLAIQDRRVRRGLQARLDLPEPQGAQDQLDRQGRLGQQGRRAMLAPPDLLDLLERQVIQVQQALLVLPEQRVALARLAQQGQALLFPVQLDRPDLLAQRVQPLQFPDLQVQSAPQAAQVILAL